MATLLHLDASPRGPYSISRALSGAFAETWKAKHPDGRVIRRDLATTPITFVDLHWIGGAYSAPEQHTPEQKQALALSDELIGELEAADEIVIGTPMYNFTVPAVLKAWIDHVVRAGKTFKSENGQYSGLLHGKKATVLMASGGNYAPGTPAEGYDQESPYMKSILGFIGITDVQVIKGGGTSAVAFGQTTQEAFLQPLLAEVRGAV